MNAGVSSLVRTFCVHPSSFTPHHAQPLMKKNRGFNEPVENLVSGGRTLHEDGEPSSLAAQPGRVDPPPELNVQRQFQQLIPHLVSQQSINERSVVACDDIMFAKPFIQ